MVIIARNMGEDELLAESDILLATVADDDDDFPGVVGRDLAGERLRAVQDELDRRSRLRAMGTVRFRETVQTHEAWRDLARTVRDRVPLPDLLEYANYPFTYAGMNGRRNQREYEAACPLCGGTDRFRIWDGPNGAAWCRGCRLHWDVVAAAQSLLPGCSRFRDAVEALAVLAGGVR